MSPEPRKKITLDRGNDTKLVAVDHQGFTYIGRTGEKPSDVKHLRSYVVAPTSTLIDGMQKDGARRSFETVARETYENAESALSKGPLHINGGFVHELEPERS